MAIKVPTFKEPGLTEFLTRMLEDRDRSRANLLSNNKVNHSLLLQSPLKKAYEVTVNDAGVLVITLVAG